MSEFKKTIFWFILMLVALLMTFFADFFWGIRVSSMSWIIGSPSSISLNISEGVMISLHRIGHIYVGYLVGRLCQYWTN